MRKVIGVLVWMALAGSLGGQSGVLDPEFRSVPFNDWLRERPNDRLKWQMEIVRPMLSLHQRLVAQVRMEMKMKDLRAFQGHRSLIVFLQVTDTRGVRYQAHGTIDLTRVWKSRDVDAISYQHGFFVRPGDYRVDAAILDVESNVHSVRSQGIRIPELKNDPLPDACRSCPPIELLSSNDPPDTWYLPEAGGRLDLRVKPKAPVVIDIVGNLSPSERLSGSLRVRDLVLALLLPSVKTFSQIDCEGCQVKVTLLDIHRRQVRFEAAGRSEMNWSRIKPTLAETDPVTIDVKALERRRQSASYFVSQVQKRIQPRHVVIVLSRPVDFETRQEAGQADPDPNEDYRLFYIRLLPPPFSPNAARRRTQRPEFPGVYRSNRYPDIFDSLVPLLKPLRPKVFNVDSAEEMRKALAAILDEINRM